MPEGGQQYLPISDAMAKDIDSGKAGDRDLVDFLPDSVAQELYDAQHPGMVHAENLIPISREQGAEMRMIDPESGTLPRFPSTRRVLPAPFRRDRISGGSHGKTWHLLTAEQVRRGDIITDLGRVVQVEQKVAHSDVVEQHNHLSDGTVEGCPGCFPVASGFEYEITGAGGKVVKWLAGREVKVFR